MSLFVVKYFNFKVIFQIPGNGIGKMAILNIDQHNTDVG